MRLPMYSLHRMAVVLVAVLCLAGAIEAQTYAPRDAAQHVGQAVTIEGVVAQVSSSGKGTIFINFGGRFPNHSFYAVIFRGDSGRFPGVHSLEGRNVAISGEIEMYRGKPQIILKAPSQIMVK